MKRVLIAGLYSDWSPIISGVPQGSKPRPVMFLIYVNDIPDIITSVIIVRQPSMENYFIRALKQ